jgi:hypothetical protein
VPRALAVPNPRVGADSDFIRGVVSLYDENAGDFGGAVAVGAYRTLSAPAVQINAAEATLVGSGIDGLELTMTLPIEFTSARPFVLEDGFSGRPPGASP